MPFARKGALLAIAAVALLPLLAADVTVQLSVNRPFNDVSEKFVSFIVRPEDMYKALDGPNRKSMTRMATMLGDSYVKFVGDYFFALSPESKVQNPTKIIWKGFNRWTRAVNWTMVIPVPYAPNSWEPMQTLKILNSSHAIGITDCIWQLGTDFGSSRALDYVSELKTFGLMVQSFKPFVVDWKIMGADVSAGSSAEETRRYIELSKDLNAAFGWTQPSDLVTPTNALRSAIYDNDPALKMLLSKKVPVWLTLPFSTRSKKSKLTSISDETAEALRWAQTMGDAASAGFDAIFKKLSISDMERPSFSFYVTALFKKVMGSRVFSARPMHLFARSSNKLYTHCANAVSGGMAFMVVNPDEKDMQISVRSMTKITGSEVWQYTVTFNRGMAMLNDEKMTLNSTLKPQVQIKDPNRPIQLSTPGQSVSFWVLPNVNLEHCQFTEIEMGDVQRNSNEQATEKRYSSSDKLLQQLIKETALSNEAQARDASRRRRYATFADRTKRFILEESGDAVNGFGKLLEPFTFGERIMAKREDGSQGGRIAALEWIKNLMDDAMKQEAPKPKPKPSPLRKPEKTSEASENVFEERRTAFLQWLKGLVAKGMKENKSLFQADKFESEEDEEVPEERQITILQWIKNLMENSIEKEKSIPKTEKKAKQRENSVDERRTTLLQWIRNLIQNALMEERPRLKRRSRSVDDYFGSLFGTKSGKHAALTKKITEIKKPDRHVKPIFNLDEFDEEEFFKKIDDHVEPQYTRLPDGDVHLKHITNADGDEVDDYKEKKKKKSTKKAKKVSVESQEVVSEMKPMRLLPTEFYESLPINPFMPAAPKMSIGGALNSLLFPEPFSKKLPKSNKKVKGKYNSDHLDDAKSEEQEIEVDKYQKEAPHAKNFFRAQKELRRTFLTKKAIKKESEEDEGGQLDSLAANKKAEQKKRKHADNSSERTEHYSAENGDSETKSKTKANPKEDESMQHKESEEDPWWELSALRKKRSPRALRMEMPDEAWRNNMITKDDTIMVFADTPLDPLQTTKHAEKDERGARETASNKLVATVKEKVTTLVDIVARHFSEWYNTIAKHIEVRAVETVTTTNGNKV